MCAVAVPLPLTGFAWHRQNYPEYFLKDTVSIAACDLPWLQTVDLFGRGWREWQIRGVILQHFRVSFTTCCQRTGLIRHIVICFAIYRQHVKLWNFNRVRQRAPLKEASFNPGCSNKVTFPFHLPYPSTFSCADPGRMGRVPHNHNINLLRTVGKAFIQNENCKMIYLSLSR